MMNPWLMAAFAGVPAATPDLSDMTDPLLSQTTDASNDIPIVSVRFNSNGDIEEATGDDSAALTYSKVGEWLSDLSVLDNTDWELSFTIDSEDVGDPGTWTGDTRGSFIVLSSTRTFTWTKDALDQGAASSEVTAILRRVSDTGTSTTRANLTYSAEITL